MERSPVERPSWSDPRGAALAQSSGLKNDENICITPQVAATIPATNANAMAWKEALVMTSLIEKRAFAYK